ncbi:hypothetical protein ScPMuIL_013443 [Solemya velum]
MSTDPDTASRRLAFQKSYSHEHGGSWRRRSLIEDAKFETVTNYEFEKRERHSSKGGSISEEEDVFTQNGSESSPVDKELTRKYSVVITLRDSMHSLSKIIRIFENTKVTLDHIESRHSRKNGAQFEILVSCCGSRERLTSLANVLRQSSQIMDLVLLAERDTEKKETWFPRHISELNLCTHLATKFEPELDSDHPGFTDMKYRARRKQIADIAFDYKYGHPITRVQYTDEEIRTWGHVFRKLKSLFSTHACREHRDVFDILEKECGYSDNNIPQLEDISNFLKKRTGFMLRPVAGLLSARDFLASLAFRVFQCTQYVRHGSKPDHSPEPDCIHELLGHVPMLADQKFAQFSQELGLASLSASDEDIEKFATLYWFTVEFGLCKQNGELRAYGAGLLSSYAELQHALSDVPERRPLEPMTTSVQEYTDDDLQPIYFVTESFDDMMEKMRQYAATIPRSNEIRYDPYTNTVQRLDNTETLDCLARSLKGEISNLERAMTRIKSSMMI